MTFKDNFRQGKVVGIDLKNRVVLLQGGEALPFSHLILATGSTGPFPGKFNEVSCLQAAIQAYEDMVKQVCHTDGRETGWAGQSAVGHS